MKNTIVVILIALAVVSCKNEPVANKESTVAPGKTEKPEAAETTVDKDKKELKKLVKEMYHWVERSNGPDGFRPFVKDSLVVGYDQTGQSLYTKSLMDSGYFSRGFIDNMNSIFSTQDELLRSGKVEWYDNEMSPFHGDSNQWCNCQDGSLSDITLHFDKVGANTATFYWNWEGQSDPSWANHHYHMRAVKEKGKWKVDYMEGWDYDANTMAEY